MADRERIIDHACTELKLTKGKIAARFGLPIEMIEPEHIGELWKEHLSKGRMPVKTAVSPIMVTPPPIKSVSDIKSGSEDTFSIVNLVNYLDGKNSKYKTVS